MVTVFGSRDVTRKFPPNSAGELYASTQIEITCGNARRINLLYRGKWGCTGMHHHHGHG